MSKSYATTAKAIKPDHAEQNEVLFRSCEGLTDRFSATGCIIILTTKEGFSLGSCGVGDEDAPDVLRAVANCLDVGTNPVGAVH